MPDDHGRAVGARPGVGDARRQVVGEGAEGPPMHFRMLGSLQLSYVRTRALPFRVSLSPSSSEGPRDLRPARLGTRACRNSRNQLAMNNIVELPYATL